MAKFIPKRIHEKNYWEDERTKTPKSEENVYKALKRLSNDWTILHGVRVHEFSDITAKGKKLNKKIPSDMESDFILVHPEMGIIYMEVKGGSISIVEGAWFSNKYSIKNPAVQAMKAMHGFIKYLESNLPQKFNGVYLPKSSGYCVVFPSFTLGNKPIDPQCHPNITIDEKDLPNIEKRIEGISKEHFNNASLGTELADWIVKLLAPTHEFKIKTKRYANSNVLLIKEEIGRMTAEQNTVWEAFKDNRRMAIRGVAGSGKTILATEIARNLDESGLDVLLICFNEPLSKWIAKDVEGTNIDARTFHSLCKNLAEEAGLLSEMDMDPNFWERDLPELLPMAAEILHKQFDAIIIDEGQDFYSGWYEVLEHLLRSSSDGYFYVFADSRQDVWGVDCAIPDNFGFQYKLSKNVRNTREIAGKVLNIYEGDEEAIGASGIEPEFIEVTTNNQAVGALLSTTKKYVNAGNPSDEIIILCDDEDLKSAYRKESSSNTKTMSIGRFKGLESTVVILFLPIEQEDNIEEGYLRSLCYTGMSRANALLSVIGTSSQKAILQWD